MSLSFCLFYIQQACLKQIENQKRRRLAMQYWQTGGGCTTGGTPLYYQQRTVYQQVLLCSSSLLREFLFCATVFRPCSWRGKSATHQQFCCESPQRYNVNEKKVPCLLKSVKTSKKSIRVLSVFDHKTTFPFKLDGVLYIVFNRVFLEITTVGQKGQNKSHFCT